MTAFHDAMRRTVEHIDNPRLDSLLSVESSGFTGTIATEGHYLLATPDRLEGARPHTLEHLEGLLSMEPTWRAVCPMSRFRSWCGPVQWPSDVECPECGGDGKCATCNEGPCQECQGDCTVLSLGEWRPAYLTTTKDRAIDLRYMGIIVAAFEGAEGLRFGFGDELSPIRVSAGGPEFALCMPIRTDRGEEPRGAKAGILTPEPVR